MPFETKYLDSKFEALHDSLADIKKETSKLWDKQDALMVQINDVMAYSLKKCEICNTTSTVRELEKKSQKISWIIDHPTPLILAFAVVVAGAFLGILELKTRWVAVSAQVTTNTKDIKVGKDEKTAKFDKEVQSILSNKQ